MGIWEVSNLNIPQRVNHVYFSIYLGGDLKGWEIFGILLQRSGIFTLDADVSHIVSRGASATLSKWE